MMSYQKATIILQLSPAEGAIMEGEITQGVAGANWCSKTNSDLRMRMKILKPLYSGSIVQVDLLLPSEMMRDELFACQRKRHRCDRIYG
jgi:hypothetical protein